MVVQHDNDPKFTGGMVQKWIQNMVLMLLSFPPYPGLNPMENRWYELEKRVEKHNSTDNFCYYCEQINSVNKLGVNVFLSCVLLICFLLYPSNRSNFTCEFAQMAPFLHCNE